MLRRDQLDGRILADQRSQKRFVGDKWVVLRGDHQHRYAHSRDHRSCARRFVILLRVPIAETWRGNRIVELPHRADLSEAVARVALRK